LSELLTILVFGVGLSIGYLLLFNRHTRQSLHDLAVGAYVVKHASGPIEDGVRVWPIHFGVVGVIVIAAAALPYVTQGLAKSGTFASLLSVQQGLQQVPDVRHATVSVGVNTFASRKQSTTTTHIVSSKLYLSRRVADLDSLANKSAQIILERDPSAQREDAIEITLIYGTTLESRRAGKAKISLSLRTNGGSDQPI
jgi:hypothetical protein